MKKLITVLGLCLASAAAFADDISVSVTYTPGAAAFFAAAGTTVEAQIVSRFNAINTVYANSGINIRLVPTTFPAGSTAPSDSSTMGAQYTWARNDVAPLAKAYSTSASMKIQISDPGVNVLTGAMSPTVPMNAQNDVIALPVRFLDTQLEYAISRNLGAGTGVAVRGRVYNGSNPPPAGDGYCVHTRESALSSTSTTVYYLNYWIIDNGGTPPQYREGSMGEACEAYRAWRASPGGSASTANATARIDNTTTYGPPPICTVFNALGSLTIAIQPTFVPTSTATTVSCADGVINLYSKNGLVTTSNPPYPLGDATHDSVGDMNNKRLSVIVWPVANKQLLADARGVISHIIAFFMKSSP